jgi:hypothetical protein
VDPKDRIPAEWPDLDAEGMLRRFAANDIDFIVIGGIALVLAGSARITRDLDIVFAPDPENLDALGKVLVDLDAKLREVDDRVPFVPDGRTLGNVQLLTLATSSGWLDVHRSVDGMPPYDELKRNAEEIDLGDFSVLAASPDDMIAMKRAAGRPQDIADLAEWETIKRLRER